MSLEVTDPSLTVRIVEGLFQKSRPDDSTPAIRWEISQDRATGIHLVKMDGRTYRLVRSESIGMGFSLCLLGAGYEWECLRRPWPSSLAEIVGRSAGGNHFYLLAFGIDGEPAMHAPLATLLKDPKGNWHLLEVPIEKNHDYWTVLTVAMHLLAEKIEDPARLDDFGDFLPLGAPSVVQRHSTERLQKHISRKVVYDARLCTHCLRCATVCNEMRAIATDKGVRLLGPSEDFCTNCGLCQKRCSYLTARPKEELEQTLDPRLQIHQGGTGIHLYDSKASDYIEAIKRSSEESVNFSRFPYEVRPVFDIPSDISHALPIKTQIELRPSGSDCPNGSAPLSVTSLRADDEALVIRKLYRAALVLQTENGKVEKDIACAAMKLGIRVSPAIEPDHAGISIPGNETTRLFYRLGSPAITGHSLSELWKNREVDLILAPFSDQLPAELHQMIMQDTGRQAHILSPHIAQALPMTKNPLMGELGSEFINIFMKHPELMEAEARYAGKLLRDVQRNYALIHARYRPMAFASGHTACPSCAEAQVLAIPVYMAMAMSLARKEAPEVSFTCETGCMSETLNKVNETAQKVPGGRTVFGGGFAFGEAIAMAHDRAVRMGYLKKGRRYVVSQGGDGGAVIGLPAWLNALRQQASLIRQRHPNVLHFINITDTQVYSNTGGESSATSLLGMGTLTTPIGKFLLGNQKIHWTLINLAAEFPGILVGAGHSANRVAMQQFWQLADQLGQSAIRWDITPCPETGKFFGEDPDDLAEIMAHAGMVPEVIFVGRLRKRIAPFHPEDRGKPFKDWRLEPKPINYWLEKDPRYRALYAKNPKTGKMEPRNLTAYFLISQLESCRDQLNWQINLETHLISRAEEWVSTFFSELKESWNHYRYRLDQFPYAILFSREGELKPEFAASLEQEMVRRILGRDDMERYTTTRDRGIDNQQSQIERALAEVEQLERIPTPSFEKIEKLNGQNETLSDIFSKIHAIDQELKEEVRKLKEAVRASIKVDPVEEEIFGGDSKDSHSLPERRRNDLYRLLDRIIEERAVAKQVEFQQYRLSQQLKSDFLKSGGIIREKHSVSSAAERGALLREIVEVGPFSIGVASLAGDRGIAINRTFANFFTARGAWAGMAWQFGSSKRGTPVLSATFVDSKPLQRKDAMYSFPMAVLTVTNYEEMKRQPDIFFSNLHPRGFLIINQRKRAEALWRELVGFYPEEIRNLVFSMHESGGRIPAFGTDAESFKPYALSDADMIVDSVAQNKWKKAYSLLSEEEQGLARKIAAMVGARIITVDMDGIMQQVTGSLRAVSNLVAIAPMFHALRMLGFTFEWEKDLKVLSQGFPEAVLRNPRLLNHYYKAMEMATEQSKIWSPLFGFKELQADAGISSADEPKSKTEAAIAEQEHPLANTPTLSADSPEDYLMIMGGTLAGMVLSQIATAEHPLFYVGFPITPAGNPFYAMADAFANGHPYIVVDEVNPSEKVAAEKLLGIARAGGFLPVTFTASQGWRLFTEIIPQFVGARLEGLFLIAKRALAAPNLNIEESHTDFMSFRDDGGIMLAPKSIQEYIPALYIARLLTHFAKIPVIVSIGGITDTHKIGLVKVPSDERVRSWLKETLRGFDYLEHKLVNRQGEMIVHGPSGTSAVYQETQSEIEKAHQAAARVYPYAAKAVHKLTGILLDEIEVCTNTSPDQVETLFILQGSLYPNAVEALQELEETGWSGIACMSIRCFNPFPEEKLFAWFERVQRIVVLDRSSSFGSIPPLASRVFTTLARFDSFKGYQKQKMIRTLVGGLGGREITVKEMKEIMLSTHLIFNPPQVWESGLIREWLEKDSALAALIHEAAALEMRNTNRHTRVPAHLRTVEDQEREYSSCIEQLKELLIRKHYAAFLANYHQVEFIGPREVLQETALRQQIVLRMETALARHALETGKATWRHGLVLLRHSVEPSDHENARSLLGSMGQSENVSTRIKTSFGVSGGSILETGETASAPRNPEVLKTGDDKTDSGSVVLFEREEAQRIEAFLTDLVSLQGEEPLFYNPEDYEHELIRKFRNDSLSPIYGSTDRGAANGSDELIWSYQNCYRDVIDRTLQREVLVQHHAPEIREIFEGEGLRQLEDLARKLKGLLTDMADKDRQKLISDEMERFLLERRLKGYPKAPLFYLEYYRNWVAPELIKSLYESEQ